MRNKFIQSLAEYIDRHRGRIALTVAMSLLAIFLSAVISVQTILVVSAADAAAKDKTAAFTISSGEQSDAEWSILKQSGHDFLPPTAEETAEKEKRDFLCSALMTFESLLKYKNGNGGKIRPGSKNVIEEIIIPPTDYSFSDLGWGQISTIPVPDDIRFDENGIPLNYSYTVSGKTTAYASGYITSTGTGVYPGIVAVNPRIIPYGSRLWIVAYDGTVYGYGIAADTGGFIYFSNPPVADLYMWSESECDWWGVRGATVYVLN